MGETRAALAKAERCIKALTRKLEGATPSNDVAAEGAANAANGVPATRGRGSRARWRAYRVTSRAIGLSALPRLGWCRARAHALVAWSPSVSPTAPAVRWHPSRPWRSICRGSTCRCQGAGGFETAAMHRAGIITTGVERRCHRTATRGATGAAPPSSWIRAGRVTGNGPQIWPMGVGGQLPCGRLQRSRRCLRFVGSVLITNTSASSTRHPWRAIAGPEATGATTTTAQYHQPKR